MNLSGADLSGANIEAADLRETNLHSANLSAVDLGRAICERADFSNTNLTEARLIGTNLNSATLTGVCLSETQRAGWSIKGVVCELVHWDKEAKEIATFAPDDFERLWSDKTRVRIFYKGGMGPLEFSTLPALVEHLEKFYPGCSLRLESINDASGGAAVSLVIDDTSDSSPENLRQLKLDLEATAKHLIESQRRVLAERETRLQLEGEVKQLNSFVDKLILRPSVNIDNRGGNMSGDTYDTGQAGAVGPNAHAHEVTFNQIGRQIEQSMNLSELAGELLKLRQAMSQEAKGASQHIALGAVAKAEEAAKAKDSSKVAESLKAAGSHTGVSRAASTNCDTLVIEK